VLGGTGRLCRDLWSICRHFWGLGAGFVTRNEFGSWSGYVVVSMSVGKGWMKEKLRKT
jgi:hypothetical protein